MRRKYTAPKIVRRTFKTTQLVGASPTDFTIDTSSVGDASGL